MVNEKAPFRLEGTLVLPDPNDLFSSQLLETLFSGFTCITLLATEAGNAQPALLVNAQKTWLAPAQLLKLSVEEFVPAAVLFTYH
jgi:hypothetical protein